jgi:hypothetical protein
MKYILASLSLAVVLFILRDQLADLWQSITGTPHVCAGGDPSPTDDAGSDPIAEHPFFIEWQKTERERLREEWVNKQIDDILSDRSTDA